MRRKSSGTLEIASYLIANFEFLPNLCKSQTIGVNLSVFSFHTLHHWSTMYFWNRFLWHLSCHFHVDSALSSPHPTRLRRFFTSVVVITIRSATFWLAFCFLSAAWVMITVRFSWLIQKPFPIFISGMLFQPIVNWWWIINSEGPVGTQKHTYLVTSFSQYIWRLVLVFWP